MVGFLLTIFLIFIGFIFGRMNEAAHLKSLIAREKRLEYIHENTLKKMPDGYSQSKLVSGNVVISIDYFKRIMALLRGIFGGRINSYTTLLERARREAILRMKEEAETLGATAVVNIRLETASVFQNSKEHIGSLEVYAYGTALK